MIQARGKNEVISERETVMMVMVCVNGFFNRHFDLNMSCPVMNKLIFGFPFQPGVAE